MSIYRGVHVLDVGHGSCLAIVANEVAVLVDAGHRDTVLRFLREAGVRRISLVVLSHADADHVGGLIGIISSGEFAVDEVWVSSDAQKTTKTWSDLVWLLDALESTNAVELHTDLKRGLRFQVPLDLELHVLAPRVGLAATGPGSTDPGGRPVVANTMSAVVKVGLPDRPLALVAGDLDEVGLEHLLENATEGELAAPVLVFPHHGGRAAGTTARDENFVRRLCAASGPDVVVFSAGRNRGSLRAETIAAVREALPTARLACTQLSQSCASEVPVGQPGHLLPLYAEGRRQRWCCGGTMTIAPGGGTTRLFPLEREHVAFIRSAAPTPLCGVGL